MTGQQTGTEPRPRLQRVPPNDPRLEADLLGAALLDQRTADLVTSLAPDAWYTTKHATIAHAIAELRSGQKPTDAGTVASLLNQQGFLDQIGSYPALTQLVTDTPTTTPASTTGWAETLTQLAHKRRQLHLAGEIAEAVYRGVTTTSLVDQLGREAQALETSRVNSWEPVNLTQVLAGDTPTITPTCLARADGINLLYPGKVHALNAEPEAGKSWVALHACTQQITTGHHVCYFDLEDDAPEIVARLLHLGASPLDILERFHYVRPDDPLDPSATAKAVALADTHHPTLAVIDGVTEALAGMGGSVKDNDDIARFLTALPRPLARTGCAVLILDHVVKNKDTRGRWGLGGEHKLAGLDGAVYGLEIVTPFAIGKPGSSRLIINKDRHGQVRRHSTKHGPTETIGIVKYDAHPDGSIDVTIQPDGDPATVAWSGPTHCQDAILELLSAEPREEFSQVQLTDRLRAKGNSYRKQTVVVAAEQLVETGRLKVQHGPRNARLYSYQETSDDTIF